MKFKVGDYIITEITGNIPSRKGYVNIYDTEDGMYKVTFRDEELPERYWFREEQLNLDKEYYRDKKIDNLLKSDK